MPWNKVKQVLGTVAPFIGTLVGGPLGGGAGKIVSQLLLGKDKASARELEAALSNATPDQLVELKRLDVKFKTEMAALGVTEQEIAAMDRDSARQREIVVQDRVPGILALSLTIGFFGALAGFALYPIQPGAKVLLDTMIGSLGTVWIMAMSYYFGSSIGSARKTEILGKEK
jgi:hypothetical protein